jgi:hypothetical protein
MKKGQKSKKIQIEKLDQEFIEHLKTELIKAPGLSNIELTRYEIYIKNGLSRLLRTTYPTHYANWVNSHWDIYKPY